MEEQSKFNWFRRDSGETRLFIVAVFCIVVIFFLYRGCSLIKDGVTGNWQIVSSFKGLELYITSISPGLLIILLGALILILGLPKVLKEL